MKERRTFPLNNYKLLILGMMLVTYIPRFIPFALASKLELPDKLRRFLRYIPYTALGALIIPGVFTATPEMPLAALTGAAFAFIFGWIRGGIIIPVLGAILTTYLVLLI